MEPPVRFVYCVGLDSDFVQLVKENFRRFRVGYLPLFFSFKRFLLAVGKQIDEVFLVGEVGLYFENGSGVLGRKSKQSLRDLLKFTVANQSTRTLLLGRSGCPVRSTH